MKKLVSNLGADNHEDISRTVAEFASMFFIHIPKTGGSYVTEIALKDVLVDISPPAVGGIRSRLCYMLSRARSHVSFEKKKIYSAAHCVCTKSPPDSGWFPRAWNNSCAHLPEFKRSLVFSVVRNPFDLLVSMYSYGFPYRRPRPSKPMPEVDRHGFPFNTFESFVTAYCDSDYPWIVKAQQQSLFFQLFGDDGTCGAHYVIRNEHLDEGLSILCEPMGIVPVSSTERPKASRGTQKGDYRKFYDKRLRALVEDACAHELHSFGYSFDGDDGQCVLDTSAINCDSIASSYRMVEDSDVKTNL